MSGNDHSALNYDISAGELRATGMILPDKIPDCATVPRHSITWSACNATISQCRMNINFDVVFHAPFEWVEVNATIERQDGADVMGN